MEYIYFYTTDDNFLQNWHQLNVPLDSEQCNRCMSWIQTASGGKYTFDVFTGVLYFERSEDYMLVKLTWC